jgi:hypothetical protein
MALQVNVVPLNATVAAVVTFTKTPNFDEDCLVVALDASLDMLATASPATAHAVSIL